MKKLTIKQAIDQGYTRFGIAHQRFQRIQNLGIDKPDFNRWIVLFSKEPMDIQIEEDFIKDLLADALYDHVGDITGDDDPQYAYDGVMKIDCLSVVNQINKILEGHKYYTLTDTQLIPEPENTELLNDSPNTHTG